MNPLQMQDLLREATRKSKQKPDTVFYIMVGAEEYNKDTTAEVTSREDVAIALSHQGCRLFAKMINGYLYT